MRNEEQLNASIREIRDPICAFGDWLILSQFPNRPAGVMFGQKVRVFGRKRLLINRRLPFDRNHQAQGTELAVVIEGSEEVAVL